MKYLFWPAMFAISLAINLVQQEMLETLVAENTKLTTTIESYKELSDSVEMEAHEINVIGAILRSRNKHVPPIVIDQWATTIQQGSQVYDLNVNVMMSLFRVESAMVHYSPEGFITVSYKHAGGIGQIMRFWYKECPHSTRPKDLDNASINLMCSAFILRQYLDENDQDIFLALTAYNSGPNGVRLMLRGRDITNGYARKILNRSV